MYIHTETYYGMSCIYIWFKTLHKKSIKNHTHANIEIVSNRSRLNLNKSCDWNLKWILTLNLIWNLVIYMIKNHWQKILKIIFTPKSTSFKIDLDWI